MASNSAQGIYVPSLIVQDHGYPLWLPDPFSNVPPNNVRPGTQVGDLGYLTEDGGFVYLFNVCKDANDPVNLGRVPPDFAPVTGIPVLNSIRENKFIHDKNSAISTNAVRHKAFGFDVSLGVPDIPVPVGATCGFEITNSSSTAAALILPNGGERYDSEHRGLFRVYATSNAHSWYKYFNGVQGRDIRNGTLYLVTGCDKCYSFANMCYSHPSSSNSVSLKFWVTDALTFTGTGRRGWDVEPSVHTRHRDREPGTTDANYTIFLRGYTISVREESSVPVMAGMPSTSVLPATSGKKAQHFGPEFPYSSTLQRSTEQAATRTGTSGDTQGYDVGMESTLRLPKFDDSKIIEGSSHEYPGSRVSEFSEGNLEPDISVMGIPYADTLVQQLPGQDKISNPSAFINEYILDNYSGATVALTHDDFKWMGVENNVKNPLDVVELAKYAIEKKLVLIRQSETTPTAWVAQREDQDIVGGPLTP
ncbi:hypothetical protein F5146DRAFT_771083 [Armillaria mellea]|nr:hypothetical protein F5146DRAFT_771083 [Armillaria mellea]